MVGKRRRDPDAYKMERHVRVFYWVMETPAWADLNPTERALYLLLKSRYNGANNGKIVLSCRQAAEMLNCGKDTAAQAAKGLIAHGFAAVQSKGKFSRKVRHATEWRLTEHPCDVTGDIPSKEFARWHPQKQNTVPEDRQTVPENRPTVPQDRQMGKKVA